MTFANGYANIRQVFEYIVFRYMIFINFSSNKFKNFNEYFIGDSYLTLNSFIKRANFQINKNHIALEIKS